MLRTSSAKISIITHTLLFLIVVASTLNYLYIADYALNGNWDPYYFQKQKYISLVPEWQKLLKDVFSILLLFVSLWFRSTTPKIAFRENHNLIICYALCLISLAIAIARSIANEFSITLVFSCLRPFIVVVSIFVFCHRHLHPYYMRWVLEAMNPLALIQVYYSYLQRETGVVQNGIGWFSSGLARSVGTFIGPNTLGLFLALVFYLNLSVLPPYRLRFVMLLLSPIGIFFSGSRTALLIIVLLVLVKIYTRLSKVFKIIKDKLLITFFGIPLFLIIAISALSRVNELSGRSGSSSSGDGRVDILKGYFNQVDIVSLFFGKYLGFGSNLVITLNNNTGAKNEIFIADSTLTSMLTQFGFLGIFIFICICCILLSSSYHQSYYTQNLDLSTFLLGKLNQDKLGFVIYFINTASTIVLFEFYACIPIIIPLMFILKSPKIVSSIPLNTVNTNVKKENT